MPVTPHRRSPRVRRPRQVALLVVPLARAMPWWPLAAAGVMSLPALLPALRQEVEYAALLPLRLAAIMLGGAAAFAMVDRMAPTTVAPTPRWLRQWLRLGLVLLPATACWVGLAVLAGAVLGADAFGPIGDVGVEAAVCALVSLAAAAVAARHRHTGTAALAGPLTQALLITGTLFLPNDRSAWPLPNDPAWSTVHTCWLACLPVLAVVLVLANRELWPPPRRRHRHGGARYVSPPEPNVAA